MTSTLRPFVHNWQEVANEIPMPRLAKTGRVGIVGLGYVGLPTALSLAESGVSVVGYDISEARLSTIKDRRVDLLTADHLRLDKFLDSDLLTLTTEPAALRETDTVVICVPTPVDAHLVPDLRPLSGACQTVVEETRPGQTIILTSTTYVGCTRDLLVEPLRRRGLSAGKDVYVAFSPERIDPGVAAHVPERTPRVVGGVTPDCTRHAIQILSESAGSIHPVSSPETAELTKLLENSFRAVNIALANEFADISRQFQVDPIEVIQAAATKPYGFMPFYPGPGVGGHCIPCDPHYLVWQLKSARTSAQVIEASMASIAARPGLVVRRAQEVLADAGLPLAGSRILIVGAAYKPAVADVRESPALEIMDELASRGVRMAYTDAHVESVEIKSGRLITESEPGRVTWDLVIAHTIHPEVDHSWISSAARVLDATYTLGHIPNRHIL